MFQKCIGLFFSLIGITMLHANEIASPEIMPQDFVYIADVDPSIIQSTRYYTSENFLGRPVPGYESAQMVMTQKAALALKTVQAEVKKKGYSLVVYDTYRPQQACDAFKAWSKDPNDIKAKAQYYPELDKATIIQDGYVARRSTHSRGSTVDLTLIPLGQSVKPITVSERTLNNGKTIPFLDDGTVDMGSSFDLFDVVSHQNCQLITKEQLALREYLKAEMKKQGFQEIAVEWWHFTLKDEPYPDTHFDFVVPDKDR